MSHVLSASKTSFDLPPVDAGRVVGILMAATITIGLAAVLTSAVSASDCVGTAMTEADVVLPTLIG
ncbi:MAG: hypothetical protein AAFV19_10525 [Pseudomonadota bacterium]